MGGFGGSGGTTTKPPDPLAGVPATQAASAISGISTEFANDGAVRMPVYNSPAQLEAARLQMAKITGRSGRSSTALVNSPGVSTYGASFLGSSPGAAQ